MTIYLVYGLDRYDVCNEPYVKKAFACKIEAEKYCKSKSVYPHNEEVWYVEGVELERPPNLD
jgi:hypothetical protein